MNASKSVAAKSKAATADKIVKAKPIAKSKAAQTEVHPEQRAADRRADDAMKFAVQQMQTPAVLETPPALTADPKAAEFAAAIAKLAEQFGMPAPALTTQSAKPKQDKQQRNGITRPGANTTCGKIWAACDAISLSQGGAPATIAALTAHSSTHGINGHTIKTQYSRWRHYNGVAGRLPTIAVNQTQSPWMKAVESIADPLEGIPDATY